MRARIYPFTPRPASDAEAIRIGPSIVIDFALERSERDCLQQRRALFDDAAERIWLVHQQQFPSRFDRIRALAEIICPLVLVHGYDQAVDGPLS